MHLLSLTKSIKPDSQLTPYPAGERDTVEVSHSPTKSINPATQD